MFPFPIEGGVGKSPSGKENVQLPVAPLRSRTASCARLPVWLHPGCVTKAAVVPAATTGPVTAGPVVSEVRTFPVAGSSRLSSEAQADPPAPARLTHRAPPTDTTGPDDPAVAGAGTAYPTAPRP